MTVSPMARRDDRRRRQVPEGAGESWLTAAIPMENPYCSCKLTRVLPQDPAIRIYLADTQVAVGEAAVIF